MRGTGDRSVVKEDQGSVGKQGLASQQGRQGDSSPTGKGPQTGTAAKRLNVLEYLSSEWP